MTHTIDILKRLHYAFILAGYDENATCAKIVGSFLRNELEKEGKNALITIELIQQIVADYYNIPVEFLQLKTKKRGIVLPRQICYYFAEKYKLGSLEFIGKSIANRDHATVIFAKKTVNNLMLYNKDFAKEIEEIRHKIEQID